MDSTGFDAIRRVCGQVYHSEKAGFTVLETLDVEFVNQDPKGGPDRKTGETAKGFKASDLDIRMAKPSNAGNRNWQLGTRVEAKFWMASVPGAKRPFGGHICAIEPLPPGEQSDSESDSEEEGAAAGGRRRKCGKLTIQFDDEPEVTPDYDPDDPDLTWIAPKCERWNPEAQGEGAAAAAGDDGGVSPAVNLHVFSPSDLCTWSYRVGIRVHENG